MLTRAGLDADTSVLCLLQGSEAFAAKVEFPEGAALDRTVLVGELNPQVTLEQVCQPSSPTYFNCVPLSLGPLLTELRCGPCSLSSSFPTLARLAKSNSRAPAKNSHSSSLATQG